MIAHILLEWSAYVVGLCLYWQSRAIASSQRLAIAAGAVAGAAVGSKVLYVLDYWSAVSASSWSNWLAGKTIVGGLLGGLLGVEITKRAMGWHRSTGDAFVAPLLVGMIIGRVGCQLSDARDLTYGIPTSLPWGWNYGDGIPRHPTALYEIVALVVIGVAMWRFKRLAAVPGDQFRVFMVSYLALRFGLDFLKPPHGQPVVAMLVPNAYAGLSAIQWACIAGIAWYWRDIRRWLLRRDDRNAALLRGAAEI